MTTEMDEHLARPLRAAGEPDVALEYWRQEELVVLPHLVPEAVCRAILREADAARPVRRSVPGYKQSGSVSAFALAEHAPTARALYGSPLLVSFLSGLCEQPLLACPGDDPHAYAIYRYEQPGDRVGLHYDTSWYEGARYTVLIGLEDDSSARLQCKLFSRDRHRPTRELLVATGVGTLVFFNGDKLLHGVTPLGAGERRVVLTLQYVTDPRMTSFKRWVSNLKDAFAYFGLEGLRRPRTPPLLPQAR